MAERIILTISGMHCASCAKVIESTLEDKEGVVSISVNYDSKKAFLEIDKDKFNLEEIKDEIASLGYEAS